MHVLSKVGEGSFAEIFRVRFDGDDTEYACKVLRGRYRTHEEVQRLPEVQALQALSGHPNIVGLVDVQFEASSGSVLLICELLQQNLHEFLSQPRKRLPEPAALSLTYQLLRALSHMHSRGMFHRDIKPENCMVDPRTLELKLIDFGSTAVVRRSVPLTEYIVTRWYRPPECLLTSGSYGPRIDIWAVGCILYEMVAGGPLFPGTDEFDQIEMIHAILGTPPRSVINRFRSNPNEQADFVFPPCKGKSLRTLLPNGSDGLLGLLEKLLKYDPEQRITAEKALRLPVFAGIREELGLGEVLPGLVDSAPVFSAR
jgi:renal tumor antigen